MPNIAACPACHFLTYDTDDQWCRRCYFTGPYPVPVGPAPNGLVPTPPVDAAADVRAAVANVNAAMMAAARVGVLVTLDMEVECEYSSVGLVPRVVARCSQVL